MHNQLRLGRIKLQAHAPTDPDYLSNVPTATMSAGPSPKREVVQETKPQVRGCKNYRTFHKILRKVAHWSQGEPVRFW